MMYYTHLVFAALAGIFLLDKLTLGISNTNKIIFLAIILISSLIPDLDESKSFLGKYFKPIGWIFKHRGIFHSIFLMIIITIIVFLITKERSYAYAVMIGFGSHLFLDVLTPQGLKPFWPSKLKVRRRLKNK